MENQAEILAPKSKTLSAEELADIVFDTPTGTADQRFQSGENGGAFHYSPLDSLTGLHQEDVLFSVVTLHGEIVALAELQQSLYDEHSIWLKSVSVDSEKKEQGLSRRLLEEVFSHVARLGKTLVVSSYRSEGERKIKHIIDELSKTYGVSVEEEGDRRR